MQYPKIAFNDIQGLLIRSYSFLPEACYVMLQFTEQAQVRAFLADLLPDITRASHKRPDLAFHIAFTNTGIARLIPQEQLITGFAPEFTEGLNTKTRSRILGDFDTNAPEKWYWGGDHNPRVDAVLMIFAKDSAALENKYQDTTEKLQRYNITEVTRLNTTNIGSKEHFGFEDGIMNPLIAGVGGINARYKAEEEQNVVMPGEFILGYPNEYEKFPLSPGVKTGAGDTFDIGRNGSYMVFRQLEQDVKVFWEFIFRLSENDPHLQGMGPELIAAKIMGRRLNGEPLAPAAEGDLKNFFFAANDKDGYHCPIGSHIRKSNPRDGIDDDPGLSVKMVKKHKILRRGRAFGAPLSPDFDPATMRASENNDKRGLYFICFNAQINRQFEFIQNAWCNNNKFDGLNDDIDPIVGFPFRETAFRNSAFTIQGCPVRKKINDIPQFVFVRGGAYFFMPGMEALKYLANATGL